MTRIKFLDDSMAENLKKIVVNLTLPIGLFSSFIKIRFEVKYLLVFLSIYVTCFILFYLGKLLAKTFKIKNKYFPFLLTGYEAGMIGYTLFAVAYGTQHYSAFGIVDVGQVSFVFTLLVPMILAMNMGDSAKGENKFKIAAKTAFSSPVLWSIILGLTLSIFGIWRLEGTETYKAIDNVFSVISAPTTFLICLVIGNGLKLSFKGMKLELITNVIRIALMIAFATIIKFLVFDNIGMEPIYTKALYIMFVLPAPFVIPAFMKNPSQEDKTYVANTLSLGTIFALIAFVIITTVF